MEREKITAVCIILIVFIQAYAQIKTEFLHTNHIKVNVCNDGISFSAPDDTTLGMFYTGGVNPQVNTLYNSSLWMGGIDAGGNLHMAAQTYRQAGVDYAPFPLNASPQERPAWNYLWKVIKSEVDQVKHDFDDNGMIDAGIPPSILYWPAKGNTQAKGANNTSLSVNFAAAPFHDRNGDGVYNANDGDYPITYGDEMYWWIFTDSIPIHTESLGKSLGVEVSTYAYAFNLSNNPVINRTVFLRYEILNRSVNTYNDFFVGLFTDVDLGCFNNNYMGCDTVNNFYYGYTGRTPDTCSFGGYVGFENEPAVQTITFLNQQLDRFGEAGNVFNLTLPQDTLFYLRMQAIDENGQYPFNPVTNNFQYHMVSGDPAKANEWSEVSQNYLIGDRKIIGSTGPKIVMPGEKIIIEVAYTLHPNSNLSAGDLSSVQAEVEEVKQFHNSYHPVSLPEINGKLKPLTIYPNPSLGTFTIPTTETAHIVIYDLTGKLVKAILTQQVEGTVISGLQSGTYIISVDHNGQQSHCKIVVL